MRLFQAESEMVAGMSVISWNGPDREVTMNSGRRSSCVRIWE